MEFKALEADETLPVISRGFDKMREELGEIEIEDGIVNIQLDEMAKFDQQSYMDITFARFRIAKDIWENIEEVTKVNFVDAFEKREESDDEEEDEE